MRHILLDAKHEIQRLRRENEILHAKVSTMELFATVLHSNPNCPPIGATVDVAWEIQKAIDEIDNADAAGPR